MFSTNEESAWLGGGLQANISLRDGLLLCRRTGDSWGGGGRFLSGEGDMTGDRGLDGWGLLVTG